MTRPRRPSPGIFVSIPLPSPRMPGSGTGRGTPQPPATYWTYLPTDQSIGPLSAGNHTFKLWVDYSGAVGESNESNNDYERTISVGTTAVSCYVEAASNASFVSPASSGWTTQRQWTFSNLTPGQTYWYRVKASSGSTVSAWSNVVQSQQQPTGQANLYRVTPCRVFDTRNATGAPILGGGEHRTFAIVGKCGIPSSARSIVANVMRPSGPRHGRRSGEEGEEANPGVSCSI